MSFFVIIEKEKGWRQKMDFLTLRKQYPEFHYYDFEIEETDKELNVIYHFEIAGLEKFSPSYRFIKKNKNQVKGWKVVKELIFSIGLVELVSYWKATCSPKVIIHAGELNDDQKKWWKKLYYHGLGEFLYLNGIEISQESLMMIESCGTPIEGKKYNQQAEGNLIPVGGGKDSFVTLEILKELKDKNHAFVINSVISAINASHAAGYKDQLITVERRLDPRLFELNKKGYLNGHTPFSAVVAFTSVLTAVLYGKKYVCLSNESSANESTVEGDTVNHQYSKSFEFEQDFNRYLQENIQIDVHYFSLLRSLSELQIASIFSTLTNYLPVFRSCNVGSKQGVWCNHCAKCLFVYVILSAFLDDNQVGSIFNDHLLEKESLEELLKELCGASKNKPFECVGTREEVQVAIQMGIEKREKAGTEVPLLYKRYKTWNLLKEEVDIEDYRQEWNSENNIPEDYRKMIKEKLELCWK